MKLQLTLLLAAATLSAAAPGGLIDLGTLGGAYSSAYGVNNRGQVVGMSYPAAGGQHAFLWDNGQITDLGLLPDAPWYGISFANAINNRGQVVGQATASDGNVHAFLWEDGVMQDLGVLPGMTRSIAYAINDRGQVVGASYNSVTSGHAFLWDHGVMTDLGTVDGYGARPLAINNASVIAGELVGSAGVLRPFVWESGAFTTLSPFDEQQGGSRGINNFGQIVGYAGALFSPTRRAFLYDGGQFTELTALGGRSAAYAINNQGLAVGESNNHAVIWVGGQPTDLGTLGGTSSFATAVSDNGYVVGSSSTGTQQHAFLYVAR